MEDYKEKYEQALERARGLHEQGMMPERIEYIFPELKESEDEKIRKAIIEHIDCKNKELHIDSNDSVTVADAIAWLEKQGEHANFRNKIQIGDEVTRNEDGALVNISQFKRIVKQGKQKPIEWNADDLLKRNQIITILKEYNRTDLIAWLEKIEIIWLKSIKDRVQPQPKQEWSEEDEIRAAQIISDLEKCTVPGFPVYIGGVELEINWLKSLKERMKEE